MHPNVVNVYDVGQDRGVYYMVMELVEGITLKEYIEKKGRLSAKETISISIQMVTGIQAAHNQHIIHRDIKPQNKYHFFHLPRRPLPAPAMCNEPIPSRWC